MTRDLRKKFGAKFPGVMAAKLRCGKANSNWQSATGKTKITTQTLPLVKFTKNSIAELKKCIDRSASLRSEVVTFAFLTLLLFKAISRPFCHPGA